MLNLPKSSQTKTLTGYLRPTGNILYLYSNSDCLLFSIASSIQTLISVKGR